MYMRDEFNDEWNERAELLAIEESKDPFCVCDEYGEDNCPIHSQVGLDIIQNEDVQKLSIKRTKKRKCIEK